MTAHALSAHTPVRMGTGRVMLWTGRALTVLISAMLLMDASMKLFRVPQAVEGTTQLGYSPDVILPLGIINIISLALYLYPRTAALGALLWTAYLGGAVATHVRLHNPMYTHTLSPVYVALILWGALWLRDERVRALFPFRRSE